jgi:hypothetical protein
MKEPIFPENRMDGELSKRPKSRGHRKKSGKDLLWYLQNIGNSLEDLIANIKWQLFRSILG